MLGTMLPDWEWHQLTAASGGSPWTALRAWEGAPDPPGPDGDLKAVASRVASNMAQAAAARRRIRRTARQYEVPSCPAGDNSDSDAPAETLHATPMTSWTAAGRNP